LIAGGLFARSLAHQSQIQLGFAPDHVWTFTLDASGAGYGPARGQQVFSALLPRVRALPGVEAAGMTDAVPLGVDHFGAEAQAPGQPGAAPVRASVSHSVITHGYFSSLRIPLLSGRGFSDNDKANSPPVAIVSVSLAHQLWPGRNPLGRSFALDSAPGKLLRVVGVVGDVCESMVTRERRMPIALYLRAMTQARSWWCARRGIRCAQSSKPWLHSIPIYRLGECKPWRPRSTGSTAYSFSAWARVSPPAWGCSPCFWRWSAYTEWWPMPPHSARTNLASGWRWARDRAR